MDASLAEAWIGLGPVTREMADQPEKIRQWEWKETYPSRMRSAAITSVKEHKEPKPQTDFGPIESRYETRERLRKQAQQEYDLRYGGLPEFLRPRRPLL